MAVAKSYEDYEIQGEPFVVDKKMYVIVSRPCPRCSGTGNYSYNQVYGTTCMRCNGRGKESKQVRWYTDAQRAAMDKRAGAKAAPAPSHNKMNARYNFFGFGDAGYIHLVCGEFNKVNEWAHETDPCRARFTNVFGWFIPSTMEMPELPEGITLIKLPWDEVADETDPENCSMKDINFVEQKVRELRGEISSNSEYQGEVGQWMDVCLVVRDKFQSDTRYGDKFTHIMIDANGNVFQWATGTKNYAVGTSLHLKVKVKEHKEIKHEKRTIVWYCKEV